MILHVTRRRLLAAFLGVLVGAASAPAQNRHGGGSGTSTGVTAAPRSGTASSPSPAPAPAPAPSGAGRTGSAGGSSSGAGAPPVSDPARRRSGGTVVGRAVPRAASSVGAGAVVIAPGTSYGLYSFGLYPWAFYPWGYAGLGFGGYYSPWWYGYGDPYWYGSPWSPSYYAFGGGPVAAVPAPEPAGEGALRIRVKPREALVYVDGRYVGHVDDFDGLLQKLHLPAGAHHVEVREDGYSPLAFDVTIEADQTTTYRGALERLPR